MNLAELLGQVAIIAVLGVMGVLCVGVVLTLVFGKRIEKRFDLEADFTDETGRECGEFEVESYRVVEPNAALQPEFTVRAKFKLRHPALAVGCGVRVRGGDELVFDASPSEAGEIFLYEDEMLCKVDESWVGRTIAVEVDGSELFASELRWD